VVAVAVAVADMMLYGFVNVVDWLFV